MYCIFVFQHLYTYSAIQPFKGWKSVPIKSVFRGQKLRASTTFFIFVVLPIKNRLFSHVQNLLYEQNKLRT